MESFFSVLLVMCLWSSGLCQNLDESRMQAAIKILSDRFEGLKQSGLAVNDLQVYIYMNNVFNYNYE